MFNGMNNNSGAYGCQEDPMNIDSLIMVPTKEQHDVVQRAMTLNVNDRDINTLHRLITTSTTGKLSEIEMATELPNIIGLSNTPNRMVGIENGWNTKRFRFILTVSSIRSDGSVFRSYVQGYSNYADVSFGGHIDPNTKLTINSIINTLVTHDPVTRMPFTRLHSAFNVIFNTMSNRYEFTKDSETMRLLRPTDVIKDASYLMVSQSDNIINMDNRHAGVAKASRVNNKVGSSHVTSVLNAFNVAKSFNTDVGYGDDDVFQNASASVNEMNLSNIPFISKISDLTHQVASVEFNLGILEHITPNVGDKIYVGDSKADPVSDNSLFTNDVASLAEVTKEATIASTVAESVTGMLMDSMLTSVSFSVTNMTTNGMIIPIISEFDSVIPDLDKTALINKFTNKLVYVLMPQLTESGLLGLEIMASVDIFGDARVSVYLSGGRPIVYSVPTYADSLFTSIVSDRETHDRSMSEYSTLTNMVLG